MQALVEGEKINIMKYWPVGASLFLAAAILSLLLSTLLPLIVFAVVFLTLLITWRPLIGFCLMVFFIPLEDLTLISFSFTFIKFIGIVTFWGWLMHLFINPKPVKTNSFIFLLITFILWSLLSITWALVPDQSITRIISLAQLLVMFFLGYNLVDKKRDVYFIIGSYLLGAFLASCLGIYSGYLYGFTTRIDIGGIHHPNYFARLLSLGLIFNVYLLFILKKAAPRIIGIASACTISIAILLTGSRGAWLALFFALAAALLLTLKNIKVNKLIKKRSVLVGLLIVIALAAVTGPLMANHLPSIVVERAETFTQIFDADNRGAGRMDIWLVGLEVAKDNIIRGVGLNNFPYAFTEHFSQTEGVVRFVGLNRDAHNNFLTVLTELGIPGFLLFLLLFTSMWKLGNRTEKTTDSILCKTLVIFLIIAGLTNTDNFSKFFWLGLLIPSLLAQFGILKDIYPNTNNVKTLFLSSIFPNQYNLTYGIFSFRLVQNLKSQGVSVIVIAPVPYAPPFLWFKPKWRELARVPWSETIEGVKIIHPRQLCLPGRRFNEWNTLFMYWAVFPAIKILHHRLGFNVIHSYGVLPAGFAGQLAAERLKLRSTCTAIGTDINILAKKSKTTSARTKYVLDNVGKVVSVGRELASKANQIKESDKEIKVIHEGVDRDMFDTTGADQVGAKIKAGFKGDHRIILFVGRLVQEKGVYELIDAFTKVEGKFPEARLAIVGEGPEKENLARRIEEKGLKSKVKLAGNISHKELVRWYTASELVTLLSYYEGVPNIIKEAMSCSKPVIASRTVGIQELVTHGETGILVDPRSVDQPAEALKELLSKPELCREMGLKGRKYMQETWPDWTQTAKEYKEVYNKLIYHDNTRK